MTGGTQGGTDSTDALPAANRLLAIIVALGWLAQGCGGRTALLATDARESSGTRTATSTVTATGLAGRSDASPATSQPTTDGGCPTGFTACGRGAATRCYDLGRSVDHCGQCGNACAPGIACQSSKCQQYQCQGTLTFKALPAISTVRPAPDFGDMASYASVLGDFDGDGTLDFIGQPEIGAPMGLLLGNGDGTFRGQAVAPAFSRDWRAAAADLNGDGWLDLASITYGESAVTVRLGNGDPATVFGPATTYPTASPPGGLLLADLDDDGHVDMVAAEAQRLTLWRGAADGPLAAPTDIPVGLAAPESYVASSAYLLRTADWNQDGVPDLLYGMYALRMLLGRGDGTFDKEIACGLALDFGLPSGIPADLDHDQKIDLVINGSNLVGTRAFLGMNGCNYSTAVAIPHAPPYGGGDSFGVADLDGDGNPDIIVGAGDPTHGNNGVSVSLGDGRGGFASPLGFPSSVSFSFGSLLVGDLNHDTKLDLIVTRPDGWQVLLNTCP